MPQFKTEACKESFIDMIAGTQDHNMNTQRKSLGYNSFHLQKIRCLYGTRATLDLNKLVQSSQLQSELDNMPGLFKKITDNTKDEEKENGKEIFK